MEQPGREIPQAQAPVTPFVSVALCFHYGGLDALGLQDLLDRLVRGDQAFLGSDGKVEQAQLPVGALGQLRQVGGEPGRIDGPVDVGAAQAVGVGGRGDGDRDVRAWRKRPEPGSTIPPPT